MTPPQALISAARKRFLAALLQRVLAVQKNVPSNADGSSEASVEIAKGILGRIGKEVQRERLAGQSSGNKFEDICAAYLRETFLKLEHLRPGLWSVIRAGDGTGKTKEHSTVNITNYEQYAHLTALALIAKKDRQLAAALRSDYAIRPDIVVIRQPEPDDRINRPGRIVDDTTARRTSLRAVNNDTALLHASVSCKWTIRSDRVQNARSEALNLIRNRKGRVPHIAVVTGEPLPSRIASIALGTGDIDCVYHFALPELIETLNELDYPDAREMTEIMVEGKRLRDISDLPLDLAI
jgi:NgoMIV restriction enzyme